MNKIVIVDSDAIFAIYNPNDPLSVQAIHTFKELITQGYQLMYPTSVIFEVVSLFQRVLPTPTVTAKLVEMIKTNQFVTCVVDAGILKESAVLFNPVGSKKNTLVDCSVIAIAKKLDADCIFSYDNFYTKHGMKLAKDAIKSNLFLL